MHMITALCLCNNSDVITVISYSIVLNFATYYFTLSYYCFPTVVVLLLACLVRSSVMYAH